MTEATSSAPRLEWFESVQTKLPGASICVVVCLAATAVASRYEAPVILFALLMGMVLSFVTEDARVRPGVQFCASTLLKAGVALMGLRISAETFMSLGPVVVFWTIGLLIFTLLFGTLIGRLLGWDAPKAIIAAGAIAICGASAALALSSVLPAFKEKSNHMLSVIMAVTGMSTLGMVFYPVILEHLPMSPTQIGIVLGMSIHDVAQVVGAGFTVSDEVGEVATLTKMIRVAFLPVVLLAVSFAIPSGTGGSRFKLPWFVVVFVILVVVSTLLPIPAMVKETATTASRAMFFVAVSGLGLLSNPKDILKSGRKTLTMTSVTTLVLFSLSVTATLFFIG